MASYSSTFNCGLLRLPGPALCLYRGPTPCPPGAPVLCSARLLGATAPVPYLAAAIWLPGSNAPPSAAFSGHAPLEDMNLYFKHSDSLAEELAGQGRDPKQKEGGDTEEQGGDSQELGQERRRDHSHEEPREKRRRVSTASSSTSGGGDRSATLKEEYPSTGVKGVVERWISSTAGIAYVRTLQARVLFQAGQVWVAGEAPGQLVPALEVLPTPQLASTLPAGTQVRLNARRLPGPGRHDLQATAVWTGLEPPLRYLTPQLQPQLNFCLAQQLYSETGDPAHLTNPLAGTPDHALPAKVEEYLSLEVGVLRLDGGDRGSVLFHLAQVWTGGDTAVPVVAVQSRLLRENLPVGCSVLVNTRKLPSRPGSSLRYQALCVWPYEDADQSEALLPQYLARYTPHRARAGLVQQLDTQHDRVKAVLGLGRGPDSPDWRPVHCVLNTLPAGWRARVIAGLGQEFGLIEVGIQFCTWLFCTALCQVMGPRGGELAPGVPSMLALFHIEDVFDWAGLPALDSPDLSIETVQVRCALHCVP